MKVNDPNLQSVGSAETARTQQTSRSNASGRTAIVITTGTSSDDVHLSELVRSLRSLAGDSPDRQAKLEALARSYANGTYRVDAQATAAAIIDEAIEA